MAAKKKSKKKSPAKTVRTGKRTPKKSTKKKASRRKPATKRSVTVRAAKAPKKQVRAKRQKSGAAFGSRKVEALAGDLDSQGLSDIAGADSESVGELLEEGNTFEAGVVRGVEQADDAEGKEVRTREFPEDDVPEEYLDKD
jgi:hypothetical protein